MADEMKPELKEFRKKIAELELAGKTPRQLYKQAKMAYRSELDPLRQKIKGFARDETGDFLDDDNKDLRGFQKEYQAQRNYLNDLARAQRSQYVQQLRGEAGLPAGQSRTARMKEPGSTPITPKTNPFANVLGQKPLTPTMQVRQTNRDIQRLQEKLASEQGRSDQNRMQNIQQRLNAAQEKAKGFVLPNKMKSGGKAKAYKAGGSVGSASKRADGCAIKGKTKGRMV